MEIRTETFWRFINIFISQIELQSKSYKQIHNEIYFPFFIKYNLQSKTNKQTFKNIQKYSRNSQK